MQGAALFLFSFFRLFGGREYADFSIVMFENLNGHICQSEPGSLDIFWYNYLQGRKDQFLFFVAFNLPAFLSPLTFTDNFFCCSLPFLGFGALANSSAKLPFPPVNHTAERKWKPAICKSQRKRRRMKQRWRKVKSQG